MWYCKFECKFIETRNTEMHYTPPPTPPPFRYQNGNDGHLGLKNPVGNLSFFFSKSQTVIEHYLKDSKYN